MGLILSLAQTPPLCRWLGSQVRELYSPLHRAACFTQGLLFLKWALPFSGQFSLTLS